MIIYTRSIKAETRKEAIKMLSTKAYMCCRMLYSRAYQMAEASDCLDLHLVSTRC